MSKLKTTDTLKEQLECILDEWWVYVDKTEYGNQVKQEIKKQVRYDYLLKNEIEKLFVILKHGDSQHTQILKESHNDAIHDVLVLLDLPDKKG